MLCHHGCGVSLDIHAYVAYSCVVCLRSTVIITGVDAADWCRDPLVKYVQSRCRTYCFVWRTLLRRPNRRRMAQHWFGAVWLYVYRQRENESSSRLMQAVNSRVIERIDKSQTERCCCRHRSVLVCTVWILRLASWSSFWDSNICEVTSLS